MRTENWVLKTENSSLKAHSSQLKIREFRGDVGSIRLGQ